AASGVTIPSPHVTNQGDVLTRVTCQSDRNRILFDRRFAKTIYTCGQLPLAASGVTIPSPHVTNQGDVLTRVTCQSDRNRIHF
ncbi:hypothetical protein A0H81_14813, partial [Grifola frondosa]